MTEIDWAALRRAARAACGRAYAPYSGFPVGAAALVDDGRVVSGCNVENASYGVTLCAECGLVSSLALGGGGRLVALVCVDATGGPLMPCGRCRQLLDEHAAPGMLVQTGDGPITLGALLPRAFGPVDLERVAAEPVVAGPLPAPASLRPTPVSPRPVFPRPAPAESADLPEDTPVGPPAAPAAAPPAVTAPGPDQAYDPTRRPYDRHDDSRYGGTPATPDTFDPEDFQ